MLVMLTVLKVATEHFAATKVCADKRSSTFLSLTRGNLANILKLHTKVTRTQNHELSNENPPD